MIRKSNNLQDIFLNNARREKVSVTIFLVNGVKLQGYITGFDNFVIMLRRDKQEQLVYKHSISTILPSSGFNLTKQIDDEIKKEDDANNSVIEEGISNPSLTKDDN